MLYWLKMREKDPFFPIGAYRSVFSDFRWKLLNLKAVKSLKIIFRKIFKTLTNLIFFRGLLVSLSIERTSFFFSAVKTNQFSGFIF